MHYSIVVDIES